MDKEFEILDQISKDISITQRKLAQRTGLSLGSANILIKRLIKKGLIKIEQVNSKNIKYMLTPSGIAEKAKRTYEYIVYSYNFITELNARVSEILLKENVSKWIFLFGEKDEVYNILANAIREEGLKYSELDINNSSILPERGTYIVLIWDTEKMNILREKGIDFVNILEV